MTAILVADNNKCMKEEEEVDAEADGTLVIRRPQWAAEVVITVGITRAVRTGPPASSRARSSCGPPQASKKDVVVVSHSTIVIPMPGGKAATAA